MKLNKKAFFRVHSWIGIKLSVLFFIVCFSGTIATLSHEMDWLFFPEARAVVAEKQVSYQERLENIKQIYPDARINYWPASPEPYMCDFVDLQIDGQRHFVFVNQYTGEVQGATTLTFQRFFRDFHYYLFIPFQVGHFTLLMFGFMLFISLVYRLTFLQKVVAEAVHPHDGERQSAFL